jgi:hypothetical protein
VRGSSDAERTVQLVELVLLSPAENQKKGMAEVRDPRREMHLGEQSMLQ